MMQISKMSRDIQHSLNDTHSLTALRHYIANVYTRVYNIEV